MSFDDNKKPIRYSTADPENSSNSQKPAATSIQGHQTPAPRLTVHYKHEVGSIPEDHTESFIKEGKVFAHTINAPFTTIPFIPAATPVLKKFDKATGQDLGFTYKGSLSSEENAQGGKDLIVKLDYIGFGVMSNKFNIQIAPLAAKIEAGKEVYKGFGCNLSTLASPIGLVHERLGAKATVTDCNDNSKSISVAPEVSYQKSSSFRPISTATFGYFFGNDATLRIPAEYVPTLQRIKAASPNLDEWKIICKRIGLSIPAIPLADAVDSSLQNIESIVKFTKSAITSKISSNSDHQQQRAVGTEPFEIPALPDNHLNANQKNDKHAAWMQHPIVKARIAENLEKQQSRLFPQNIKPSIEEKPNYIVQLNDTLEKIGKKTGHPWAEILDLNKNTLKNNPDRIYPGQELLIPENHDHARMHHPVVQARIREIMAKQPQHHMER